MNRSTYFLLILKEASETVEEDEIIGSPFFLVQLNRVGAAAGASHAGAQGGRVCNPT
jgi:hypothetical protein